MRQLAEMLQAVAGGSLRIVVEGISSKKGPKPKWLEESVNFQLTDIREGSTDLIIEAPLLEESLHQPQIPLFGRSPESLQKYTGIDLALESFNQAFQSNQDDDLLDKHLLKEMEKHQSLFENTSGTIQISGYVYEEPTEISYQSFENIKKLEEQTPPPSRARITGILDLMQYSRDLIQIKTEGGTTRAILTNEIKFEEISAYLGKKVTLEGIANFKPSGAISVIEVAKVRLATEEDEWFTKQPSPIKEQLDFKELRAKQEYKGTKLSNVVGKWPGDESINELLEMLNK
ncbi:MAG TPA: hypothetical protein VF181_00860 [Balneolaceae bacterium]